MPLGEALHGLILLVVVVIGALVAGHLFARIGQPRVLGPIVLGIAVGTVFAACPAAVRSVLVSPTSRSLLEAVGTAGLLLLMFSVGSELRGFAASGEASSGWRLAPVVLLPILICALAAWPLAVRLGNPLHPGPYGWLFVGICLGVTAVPVLVTIIKDLGVASLPVARASLRIAIVTDGLAWILVTAMVIITHSTAISIPFFAVGFSLLLVVTIVLPRIVVRRPSLGHGSPLVVMMVVAALTGAAATQLLGFHPAIGAVIAGLCFPAALADVSSQHTFDTVIDVLLPAFFVNAAMSVPLQALGDQASWGGLVAVAVLTVAAFGSKLASGFAYGLLHRWPRRSSAGLGVLLNCRGVTEIAIASVGYQAGLISPFAYAVLCGLALATTAVTAPLFRALTRRSHRASETDGSHIPAGLASQTRSGNVRQSIGEACLSHPGDARLAYTDRP